MTTRRRGIGEMDKDLGLIYRRLNELKGITVAQSAIIDVLLGKLALNGDWRDVIAEARTMAEKYIEGSGAAQEELFHAREHLSTELDALFQALSDSEAQNF